MSFNKLSKTILSVVSITSMASSIALAQLTPGPSHGGNGGGRPPQYNPCDVPTDPNCHRPGQGGGHGGGRPDRPSNPGHGGGRPDYPSHPGHGGGRPNDPYPSYPTDPYPSYPSNPYPTNPYPGNGYPSQPSQSNIVRRVSFYRSVMNQTIDLRRFAGLDSRYNGYRIVSVSASTTPNSPYRTVAQLIVDGYNYAEEVNPGHEIYLIPNYAVRLNRVGTNVALRILGSTYISEIQIELSRY